MTRHPRMAHGALENTWRAEPKDVREQHQLDDLRKAHGEATLELRARKAGVSVCWARARRDRLKSGRNCAGKVWTRRFAAGSVWDIASTAFGITSAPLPPRCALTASRIFAAKPCRSRETSRSPSGSGSLCFPQESVDKLLRIKLALSRRRAIQHSYGASTANGHQTDWHRSTTAAGGREPRKGSA